MALGSAVGALIVATTVSVVPSDERSCDLACGTVSGATTEPISVGTRRRLRVAGAVVLGALGVAEQPAGHGVDLLVVLSGQTVGIAEDDDGGDGVLRLTGKRLLEELARAHRLLIANARRGRVVIKGEELRRGEGQNYGQRDPHADHDPAGDFADAKVGEEDEGVTHRNNS